MHLVFSFLCFGLSLFCFCLVRGEKVASAQDFGRQPKGEDNFKLWFPFFPYLVVAIMYCLDIVWSKDLFVYFFLFSSDLWSGIFLAFLLSSNLWLGNFLILLSSDLWSETSFFFLFFLFSSEGEDGHSHPRSRFMVSWDFGSRLVERLVMIYVKVWPAARG